jgi:glucose-6-phosphate 1-dehydrogenase
MKIIVSDKISKKSQEILDSMDRAVTKELEKKASLGQYAVIWRDGKPVRIKAEELLKEMKEGTAV